MNEKRVEAAAVETITIDSQEFEFRHISVRKLNKVLVRLVKVIGKPLAAGLGEATKIEDADLEPMITKFCEDLNDNDLDYIIDVMFSQCFHKGCGYLGQESNFEKCFKMKLFFMYKVLAKAIMYYFDDFFAGGSDLLSILKNKDLIPEK